MRFVSICTCNVDVIMGVAASFLHRMRALGPLAEGSLRVLLLAIGLFRLGYRVSVAT